METDESSSMVTWLFFHQRKAKSKSEREENLSLALWGDLCTCHSLLEIKEVVQQYYAVLTLELRLQFKASYKLLIC